ncbi:MAG: histidinol-phosphate transaminase [Proteobacteria bacterium]|nr:histidinol-phosphate transaminase [Pseudomonadota bacterium]
MTMTSLARLEISSLDGYESAQQMANTVRLHANEASWSGSRAPFDQSMNRYPEIRPDALRSRLADWYAVPRENLLVTRGSSEAIDLLIRTFCRCGQDSIAITPPTFTMYQVYADIQGAQVLRAPLVADDDYSVDCDMLIAACKADTKLIFICSPNNPTGQLIRRATILTILESRRDKSLVVVDEAYIEFSRSNSVAELLDNYENLVVLRTLSKALALAGARCGCVIARPEIIDLLDRVLAPYALSTPVIGCVMNALLPNRLAFAEKNIRATVASRNGLAEQLRKLPVVERVWPSDANFLLVRFYDVDVIRQATADAGILLRHFGNEAGLAGCIRITVGSADENDMLINVLSNMSVSTND